MFLTLLKVGRCRSHNCFSFIMKEQVNTSFVLEKVVVQMIFYTRGMDFRHSTRVLRKKTNKIVLGLDLQSMKDVSVGR